MFMYQRVTDDPNYKFGYRKKSAMYIFTSNKI